jgi:heme-degrading monooxygenase HmoA
LDYTTLSFFNYSSSANKWWAFKQMRLSYFHLKNTKGLKFHKQLGSGGNNGFSMWPDWAVYAQLMVWENKKDFDNYLKNHPYFHENENRSEKYMHIALKPIQLKGTWNGLQPFVLGDNKLSSKGFMAVITRASIRRNKMLSFWRYVPSVSRHIEKQKSLIFAKGVGEWPLIEQATFSIWDEKAAMQDFAYQQKEHKKVVQKTREKDWYKEEMFVRFQVVDFFGSWKDAPFDKLQA